MGGPEACAKNVLTINSFFKHNLTLKPGNAKGLFVFFTWDIKMGFNIWSVKDSNANATMQFFMSNVILFVKVTIFHK